MSERYVIRRALPDEADMLTALFWRSKAYWGYDDSFMAWVRENFRVTAAQISDNHYFVCEFSGQLRGYYGARVASNAYLLDDLFVDPNFIGMGCGKMLFEHAVSLGREMGFCTMTLEADPNAEPFYLKMGAVRIGEVAGSLAGRMLPLMRYIVPDCE